MKPKVPCKDCEDREVGCHAFCELYLAYREAVDAWKAWLTAQREAEKRLNSYEARKAERLKGAHR